MYFYTHIDMCMHRLTYLYTYEHLYAHIHMYVSFYILSSIIYSMYKRREYLFVVL